MPYRFINNSIYHKQTTHAGKIFTTAVQKCSLLHPLKDVFCWLQTLTPTSTVELTSCLHDNGAPERELALVLSDCISVVRLSSLAFVYVWPTTGATKRALSTTEPAYVWLRSWGQVNTGSLSYHQPQRGNEAPQVPNIKLISYLPLLTRHTQWFNHDSPFLRLIS